MLTRALTASASLITEEPIREVAVVTPRMEELPEIASAARNHSPADEPIESRLFTWLDH